MSLSKISKLVLIAAIAIGLSIQTTAARAQDDNTRPQRTDSSNGEVTRTSVSVKRKHKHGVVRRTAVTVGKDTGKGAKVVAKGTAKGAKVGAKETVKGAKVVAKGTTKGVKVAAKGMKTAGKKTVGAFK